jgi:hypothetical protein
MATKLLDSVSSASVTKSSKSIRARQGLSHVVDCSVNEVTSIVATQWSALTVKLQGSETNNDGVSGVVTSPQLTISGTDATQVAHAGFDYRIDDVHYTIAANTDLPIAEINGNTITGYTVATDKWGGFKLMINAAGTIVANFPSATQSYDSIGASNTAVDALLDRIGGYVTIGKVLIEADGGDAWICDTDDLTNASGVETAAFHSISPSFTDLATHIFTADEIINKRAIFTVLNAPTSWIRVYVSAMTGTGEITVVYTGTEGY